MSTYIILCISVLIIISHLFDIAQKKIHIPSTLFLIILGCLLNLTATRIFQFSYIIPSSMLKILGTVGLVLIVLEGVLELDISRKSFQNMKRAFLVALFIMIASSLLISVVLMLYLRNSFLGSLLYSIPLSIISSAILIPSIHKLEEGTKEFIVYESIFSDIIGIFLFYFLAGKEVLTFMSISKFGLSLISIIVISVISSYLLIFIISRITGSARIMLTIAILLLIYNICQLANLSALMLILVFGLIINNFGDFLKLLKIPQKISRLFDNNSIRLASSELKHVNKEITFFIRTFFFLVFGYSLNTSSIFDLHVILIGLAIILIIYTIRFMYFRFLHATVFPELLLAPRGLITILLFYSIPSNTLPGGGSELGVLYFTVISSIIIMAIGLIITPKQVKKCREIANFR